MWWGVVEAFASGREVVCDWVCCGCTGEGLIYFAYNESLVPAGGSPRIINDDVEVDGTACLRWEKGLRYDDIYYTISLAPSADRSEQHLDNGIVVP